MFTNGRFSGLIFNEPQLQEIATVVRRVACRARACFALDRLACVHSFTCKLCIVHRDDSALEQNTACIPESLQGMLYGRAINLILHKTV